MTLTTPKHVKRNALAANETNMKDILTQMSQEISERPGGQLAMRFYMQPLIAILSAVGDGLKDARVEKPA
jgi:hypothetical protein